MKLTMVLAIALLSGSFPLAAQQGGNSVVLSQVPLGSAGQQSYGCVSGGSASDPLGAPKCGQKVVPACPAMFSARHLSDGSVIRTGNGTGLSHPKGIGQWLQLTLNVHQGAIATLAVHGFSNKARVTEASQGNSPDAVRTVTVYLAPAQDGQPAGNIWAPELTAVTSIDLVSLKYDDGTSWSAPNGQTCQVTPDPMMLISGR